MAGLPWIKGVDVYGGNWEERAKLPADTAFVIAKCSEWQPDSRFRDWQALAASKNLPFSAYHFGRTRAVEVELALALSSSTGVKRLWLDEDDENGNPTMPLANVLPFLRGAKAAGKDVGLYVDVNVLNQLLGTLNPNEQAELAQYPLWIAQYRNDRQLTAVGPSLSPAVQKAYGGRWAVWQYADKIPDGPNAGTEIDLDVADPSDVGRWGGGGALKKVAVATGVGALVAAVGLAVARAFGWL